MFWNAAESLGAVGHSFIDEASRGFPKASVIHIEGNCHHVKAVLREHGIDAFSPIPLGDGLADISVRKGDERKARQVLRGAGYDVW